jgi:hypothetical protein
VLPIVQSSATKQVTVANLTAGRTQTSNGIVQGTAATGYNFTANTPAAGMTSQLLNWYEEGTFTPALSFGGGTTGITYSVQAGSYTRIGNRVLLTVNIILTSKGSSTGIVRISTPFIVANNNNSRGGVALGYVENITFVGQMYLQSFPNTSDLRLGYFSTLGVNTSSTDANFANNSIIMFSGNYYTA